MTEAPIPSQKADRTQLQQIIVGLNDGIIIVDPDQTISWANEAALQMHGVSNIKDLGLDVDEYRTRFELRYRNNHIVPAGNYPIDRVVAGEAFSEIVVEVGSPGQPARWTALSAEPNIKSAVPRPWLSGSTSQPDQRRLDRLAPSRDL